MLADRLVNDIADLIEISDIEEINVKFGNTHIEYYPKEEQGFIWYCSDVIATIYQEKDEHELRFNLSKSRVNPKFYKELSTLKSEIGECF